jgi:hypothetical protein
VPLQRTDIMKIINSTVAEYVRKVSVILEFSESKCKIVGYASERLFYMGFSIMWCCQLLWG